MPDNAPTPIARTRKAAAKLGHEGADLTMDDIHPSVIASGVRFDDSGKRPGAICFTGLCDSTTNTRLVAYYDANGNCNDFVKVPC